MKPVDRVKEILDQAVAQGNVHPPHGFFWRGKSRDQLVNMNKIFGQRVIVAGNPDQSALVLALEGKAPFGADLNPPTPGAGFNRMPSGGLPAVPTANIQFIRDWIAAGCPDNDTPAAAPDHDAFWREFDNWALLHRSNQTDEDEGQIFNIFSAWSDATAPGANQDPWLALIRDAGATAAIQRLSDNQKETVLKHYGDPPALDSLIESFE